MTVRHAVPTDCEPVAKLVVRAIRDIAGQLTGEEDEARALARLEAYYREPGNRFSCDRYLVKIAEGQVAGMILCYPGSDAEALYRPIVERLRERTGDPRLTIDDEADGDEFYIDAFAVFPAFEGRGYGRELIAAAQEWAVASGIRKVALNVDVENEKAHAMYVKLGFAEDKRIRINGHDFRHMTKFL